MKFLDWNFERYRTRDRLLEYDQAIVPPHPTTAGIAQVYPWANIALSTLLRQLYELALQNGFGGTINEFTNLFFTQLGDKQIIFEQSLNEFPEEGNTEKLYFDQDDNILYYWEDEYIPINAMLINDTILNGGNAEE